MKTVINNNRGMTLIEIVIAIAILGIMSIGLLTMFTSSFKFIVNAGDRSEATFNTQSQAEQALNMKNSDPLAPGLQIVFPSDGSSITAPGDVIHKSHTENGATANVDIFQPTN